VVRLAPILAVALFAGTVLLGIGAAVHPMLPADAASQLQIIAATRSWRGIHLAMLAGSALVAAGIWARLADLASRPPREGAPNATAPVIAALIAALALITAGECLNALNTAFMASAGWHMAALFAEGNAAIVSVFDATHPIGLMAARFGNLVVALGALALGWAEWRDANRSRWFAALAWIAAAGGFIGVIFFPEASRLALAAVALLSGWQVVTAVRVLANHRSSSTTSE
jgi:uncharacterized membrane protein YhaH (DUF805 family)